MPTDEPIMEEWLKSLGFIRKDGSNTLELECDVDDAFFAIWIHTGWEPSPQDKWLWQLVDEDECEDVTIPRQRTREEVIRLLTALRIPIPAHA